MPDAAKQKRVLVIDDSIDNAVALSALLTTMGCQTAVAFDGPQGIAAAEQFDPHVAFIDLEMPGMRGCDVRHLRTNHPKSSATLICLTDRGHPDDRRMCIATSVIAAVSATTFAKLSGAIGLVKRSSKPASIRVNDALGA